MPRLGSHALRCKYTRSWIIFIKTDKLGQSLPFLSLSIVFHLPCDRLFIVVLPNSIHFELIFMVALRKFEYTIKIALWQIHGNRLPAVERTTYENLFGHWIINIFLKILSFQIFSIQLRDLSNNLLNGFNNQFWNYEYWISLH